MFSPPSLEVGAGRPWDVSASSRPEALPGVLPWGAPSLLPRGDVVCFTFPTTRVLMLMKRVSSPDAVPLRALHVVVP